MIKDKHEIADVTRNILELIGNLEKGFFWLNTPWYLNWRIDSISCPLMRNFGLYNLLPLLKTITLVFFVVDIKTPCWAIVKYFVHTVSETKISFRSSSAYNKLLTDMEPKITGLHDTSKDLTTSLIKTFNKFGGRLSPWNTPI